MEWNFFVVKVKNYSLCICLLKSFKVPNDIPLSIIYPHYSTRVLAHRSPLLCTRIPPTSPVFLPTLKASGLTHSNKLATPLFKPLKSHHAISLLTTSRHYTRSPPWPSAPFAIWLQIAFGSWSSAAHSSHDKQLYRMSPFPNFPLIFNEAKVSFLLFSLFEKAVFTIQPHHESYPNPYEMAVSFSIIV